MVRLADSRVSRTVSVLCVALGLSSAALFGACGGEANEVNPLVDAGTATPKDGSVMGPDDAKSSDSQVDARGDSGLVKSAALTIYPRHGAVADDTTAPIGPGLVLDGGFGGASVLEWMHHTAMGGAAGHGDVVILTAFPADFSDGWLKAAPFHSVQTLVVGNGATDDDLLIAADIVSRAEVVWFTGGDQADYVEWMYTPLMDAVQAVYDRGGVVGGSSAGMIILGSSVNDALQTLSENLTTQLCLANPYDPLLSFTQNLFTFPPLQRVITDPHFVGSNRFGRLATFMGRQVADGFATPDILGVGVEDGAALVIDKNGKGKRLGMGTASAFIVRGGMPQQIVAGAPLIHRGLHVVKLQGDADSFDFMARCGRGFTKDVDVDGTQNPPYAADVYDNGTPANECP